MGHMGRMMKEILQGVPNTARLPCCPVHLNINRRDQEGDLEYISFYEPPISDRMAKNHHKSLDSKSPL
jgi:hypothetical protein